MCTRITFARCLIQLKHFEKKKTFPHQTYEQNKNHGRGAFASLSGKQSAKINLPLLWRKCDNSDFLQAVNLQILTFPFIEDCVTPRHSCGRRVKREWKEIVLTQGRPRHLTQIGGRQIWHAKCKDAIWCNAVWVLHSSPPFACPVFGTFYL